MTSQRTGFIGGGNMTTAIVGGLLATGRDAASLAIAEPIETQRSALRERFPGVTVTADNASVAANVDCLVLSVKPQIIADVCRDLAATAQSQQPLIVSVAAGPRVDDIDEWLGGGLAIARVMPNQPALIGMGASGLYVNDKAGKAGAKTATDIMAAVGLVVAVDREVDIDAVTAVSGSGPAYFYLLIDMLERTAESLGLDAETAKTLARQTAAGASQLAAGSDDAMADQIARVRSPGGTTAAALDSLEMDNVRDIFSRALRAARDRATQMADEAGN
ncbi:MAG: pyrroline-5-carboxylate reductase [Pseudomonadota bacterium]